MMVVASAERRTLNVPEWARWLGISPSQAYEEARLTGAIAGVPVIRIGSRVVVSRELAERVLAGNDLQPAEPTVSR